MNYITVSTKEALFALQNHIEGEYAYCEEDERMYLWQENDGWQPVSLEGKGLTMNLYDLNKTVINQLQPMTANQITEKMNLFSELQAASQNIHYMLLCKEYNYYTIFEADIHMSIPTFGAAVCEIVSSLGDVMSIEFTEDKMAVEIWIRAEEEEDCFAFYLFPYDKGVVYYG
jgi:hypothetical protein